MSDEKPRPGERRKRPSRKANLADLLSQLESRCKDASIKSETVDDEIFGSTVIVHIPSGRSSVALHLRDAEDIQDLLEVPFDKYVFLGDYAAVCAYSDGVIECGLTAWVGSSRLAVRRIAGGRVDFSALSTPITPIEVPNPTGPEKLVLGPTTRILQVLGRSHRVMPGYPSLRIEGLNITRHDHALEILERLADSFFFQLDLVRGVPLGLLRRRASLRGRTSLPARRERSELEFPRSEYDRDPMSLYWYARSATRMPLLQFLAYYQTIEYYFPTYSQAEARRKIRNILKSPAFRAERDTDVARILLAAGSGGPAFGDERSQLRATVNECLEPGSLRDFFTESEERTKFFSAKTEGLTNAKIPVRSPDADLRNDVADRIYDIRCKIVHTKAGGRDGDVELLLPFSKEVEILYFDIELIRFVAREVLVSASSSLTVRENPATGS